MVSFSACQLIWLKNNAIGGKEVWLKAVAIVYEVLKFEKKKGVSTSVYHHLPWIQYPFHTISREHFESQLQTDLHQSWQQIDCDLQLVLAITLFIFSDFLVAHEPMHIVHQCFSNYVHVHTTWTSDVTGLLRCIQFDSLRNAPPSLDYLGK